MKTKKKQSKKVLGINKEELKYLLMAGIPGGLLGWLMTWFSCHDKLF